MEKRKTHWYLRPMDAFTNNALARYLSENAKDLNPAEIKVAGGAFLAYGVEYETIAKMQKSQADQDFSFKIYRRQGNGQIQAVDLNALSKKKRIKSAM
ncbi:MAG: hypothetical protein K9M44_02865 [Candidatus Pacebacteria bacterium]|nr:hypothetical protein [Candidatus Paceibacterota bacterium]